MNYYFIFIEYFSHVVWVLLCETWFVVLDLKLANYVSYVVLSAFVHYHHSLGIVYILTHRFPKYLLFFRHSVETGRIIIRVSVHLLEQIIDCLPIRFNLCFAYLKEHEQLVNFLTLKQRFFFFFFVIWDTLLILFKPTLAS